MATAPPIGLKIKRARERLMMTQAELGARVRKSQKTIDNWEHDRSYPKSSIGALEAVLGIRLDEPPSGIVAEDDHERYILDHPDLTDDDKRLMIRSYRKAKEEFGPPPELGEPEDRSRGRAASLATAGQPPARPRISGPPAAQRASPAA